MTVNEKYDLWQFTPVSDIRKNITLVRNNLTGRLMIKRVTSSENYEVYSLLSDITHPNLMQVYDCIADGDKCVSLCEYIPGMTLEQAVENYRPYPDNQVRAIMSGVCDGLTALHSLGLIHRDINPSNVMITQNGVVKITDYDISRRKKEEAAKDTHIMGTEGYAAPEQFGFNQTDPRADIYACGVLINFLLTGCHPTRRKCTGPLLPVVEKCLEMDREQRYSSAEELKAALFSPLSEKRKKSVNGKTLPANYIPFPGFRSGKILPRIVFFIFAVLYFFILAVAVHSGIEKAQLTPEQFSTDNFIRELLILFGCWSLFPFLLFGNGFDLAEKISRRNPGIIRFLFAIAGILFIILGFYLSFNTKLY